MEQEPKSKKVKLALPDTVSFHDEPLSVSTTALSQARVTSPSRTPGLTAHSMHTSQAEDQEDVLEESSSRIVYRANEEQIKDFVENICTEDQREHYYAFRRIRFHHPTIRKLSTAVTGTTAPKSLPLVISALSRTYISQIVDLARKAMVEQGEDPKAALTPFYLKEGYRRYHANCKSEGVFSVMPKRRLF